jgi:glucokinase
MFGSLYFGYRSCSHGAGIPRNSTGGKNFASQYPVEDITSKDVAEAANAGDDWPRKFSTTQGQCSVKLLRILLHFRVLKQLSFSEDYPKPEISLWIHSREHGKKFVPIFRNKVKLLFSELKESDAAVLGASALGWEVK